MLTRHIGAQSYSQGVNPGLDFSQINEGRASNIYAVPIHPRTLTWRSGVHRFFRLA